MPQDVFANTRRQLVGGRAEGQDRRDVSTRASSNTPLDKLARKHAGRRSLTKTERKRGRYIKARPAGDKTR